MNRKTTITTQYIGQGLIELTFTTDAEGFDTTVKIGDEYLCTITRSDIHSFVNALNETIHKYSI